MTTRTIKVDYLARVEGEGAMHVRVKQGRVEDVRLEIFEPPRFFEAFLQGRHFSEVPDIVSRICGICPVAYQMSAVAAIEDALGIVVDEPIRDLRTLLYCGEWIESHVLHIYMLHAPDFLGYAGAVELSRDYPELVKNGLALKKAGNAIVKKLGGREIHPINVRIGGFYRTPSRRELRDLREPLCRARDIAIETVRWASTLEFPDFRRDYEYVALQSPSHYPMNYGRIVSSQGIDVAPANYEDHFEEIHRPHSTALHSVIRGRGHYLTGPLARFNLNRETMSSIAAELAAEAGLGPRCDNPFQSILVRAVEVLHACDLALDIIGRYTPPTRPAIAAEPREGTGYGCTEAPRGILFHRYDLNADGTVARARIVPPTAQNQGMIEDDLRDLVSDSLDLADADLQHRCEQAIRNYDPCISCATHFLNLTVERQ